MFTPAVSIVSESDPVKRREAKGALTVFSKSEYLLHTRGMIAAAIGLGFCGASLEDFDRYFQAELEAIAKSGETSRLLARFDQLLNMRFCC